MKIFNWVHRRFHHNFFHSSSFSLHKDEIEQNVTKKIESITDGSNALLEHLALVDVLDGWKDGILTIGTLGFDPLKPFNEEKECTVMDKEEEEEEDDEEEEEDYSVNDEEDDEDEVEDESELNPLVFTAFRNKFEENLPKPEMIPISPFEGSPELHLVTENMENNDQRKKKGERITLADLFSADSDVKRKLDPSQVKPESGKKPVLRSKNGLSFAKKLIPRVGEDARPIKKLNQLMKRMLKRKIHPELEVKSKKTDGQMKASSPGLVTSDVLGVTESVSLL